MNKTSPLLLLVAAALLASCQGTKRMYEGEARPPEEIALVETESQSFGDGIVDGLTSPFATGMMAVETPDSITIDSVDGESARAGSVELLPGFHTIVASGAAQVPVTRQRIGGLGRLEFEAVAGRTYTVTGKWSRHTPPWAYELRENGVDDLIATSEPRFEDLTIKEPDLGTEIWDLVDWKKSLDAESLSYTQNGEPVTKWTQLVEVLRLPLEDPDLSLEEAAEEMAKAKRKDRVKVDVTYADGLWTERWVSTWRRKSKWQWGVAVGTVENGFMNLWVYASREPFDEALQTKWEARFRATP